MTTNVQGINFQSLFPPVNQVNGYTGRQAQPAEEVNSSQIGKIGQQPQAQGVNPFAYSPQSTSSVVANCNAFDARDIGLNRDVKGYMGCSWSCLA